MFATNSCLAFVHFIKTTLSCPLNFSLVQQIDINECSRNNGRGECQDVCRNTWGSYSCSCERLPSTKLSPDGHSCEDAGECSANNGNCSHICLSTMKQIFCLCPGGLELGDDGRTCLGNGNLNTDGKVLCEKLVLCLHQSSAKCFAKLHQQTFTCKFSRFIFYVCSRIQRKR